MAEESAELKIETLREQIDQLDERIVQNINARAELVLAIRALKQEAGLSVYDPVREGAILERLETLNKGPVSTSVVQEIYEIILQRLKGQ